jgi:hypothetical protein
MAGLTRCEIIASCGNDVGRARKDSAVQENILHRFLWPAPIGFRYRPVGKPGLDQRV